MSHARTPLVPLVLLVSAGEQFKKDVRREAWLLSEQDFFICRHSGSASPPAK